MTGDPGSAVGTAAEPLPLRPLALLRIRPFAIRYLNATLVGLSVMAQSVARSRLAFNPLGVLTVFLMRAGRRGSRPVAHRTRSPSSPSQ